MKNVRVPLPETSNGITNPVAMSVMDDLKAFLSLGSNTHVEVKTSIEEFKNKNWNLGNDENISKKGPFDSIIVMGYEESLEDPNAITTRLRKNDTKPVLKDPITGTRIQPFYIETKVNVSMLVNNKSKSSLKASMNNIRLLYLDNRDVAYHSIQFLYYTPQPYKELLVDIYGIKKEVLDSNETFEDFLEPMSDDRITLVTDQGGTIGSLDIAYKEIQHNILGYFTSDLLNPSIDYDDSTGYYSTTVEYEFRYNKPIMMDMWYPIIAYNTLIPNKYIITSPRGSVEKNKVNGPCKFILDKGDNYLRIPKFDTHMKIDTKSSFLRLFSILTTININDKRTLFNLKELGEYTLTPIIIDYLTNGEYEHITTLFNSVFMLELYRGRELVYDDILKVDEDLNVYTTVDLDLRYTYRVMFNIMPSLKLLNNNAITRIKENPQILNKLITVIKLITNNITECKDIYSLTNNNGGSSNGKGGSGNGNDNSSSGNNDSGDDNSSSGNNGSGDDNSSSGNNGSGDDNGGSGNGNNGGSGNNGSGNDNGLKDGIIDNIDYDIYITDLDRIPYFIELLSYIISLHLDAKEH